MIRFVTYEELFNHISIYYEPLNKILNIDNESLIIKESEVETYTALCEVFKIVRICMKTLQTHPISHYLLCMWGAIFQLKSLLKKETFGERTGQELFTNGLIDHITKRVSTNTQLKDIQRDLLIRAMLMDPLAKTALGTVFPTICKQTRIAAQKKELTNELTNIIRKIRDLQIDEEVEKVSKKKKQDNLDIFAFMNPIKEVIDISTPISKDSELKWFLDEYLLKDQNCNTNESSIIFWKEKSKIYPSCYQLVLKYRALLCTSIFEEQCFSSISKIVTEDRESLKDETVEMMMFFKKNQEYIFPKIKPIDNENE